MVGIAANSCINPSDVYLSRQKGSPIRISLEATQALRKYSGMCRRSETKAMALCVEQHVDHSEPFLA